MGQRVGALPPHHSPRKPHHTTWYHNPGIDGDSFDTIRSSAAPPMSSVYSRLGKHTSHRQPVRFSPATPPPPIPESTPSIPTAPQLLKLLELPAQNGTSRERRSGP